MPLDPKLREFLRNQQLLTEEELQALRASGDDKPYINRAEAFGGSPNSAPLYTLKSPEEEADDAALERRLMTPKHSGMGDVKQADRNYDEDVRQAIVESTGMGAAEGADRGSLIGGKDMPASSSQSEKMVSSRSASGSIPAAPQQPPQNEIDFGQGSINTLDNLRAAQEQANSNRFYAKIFRGLNTMGKGITGAAEGNDAPFKENIADSDRPIEQFKQLGEQEKLDPNSPVSRGLREYAKQYGMNLKGDVSAKNVEDLLPYIFKGYEADQTRKFNEAQLKYKYQELKEIAGMRREQAADDKKSKAEDKQYYKDTDRLDRLNKNLSADMAGGRSAFGKAANVRRASEAAENLVGNRNVNQLNTREIAELARVLDSILSQGQPTVSGMQKLIPSSYAGDAVKIQEYITNQNQGANMGSFVGQMMKTIKREKELASEQIKRTQKQLYASHKDIAERQPEKWNDIMSAYGLDEGDSSANSDEVTVQLSDGRTGTMPKANLEAAIKKDPNLKVIK